MQSLRSCTWSLRLCLTAGLAAAGCSTGSGVGPGSGGTGSGAGGSGGQASGPATGGTTTVEGYGGSTASGTGGIVGGATASGGAKTGGAAGSAGLTRAGGSEEDRDAAESDGMPAGGSAQATGGKLGSGGATGGTVSGSGGSSAAGGSAGFAPCPGAAQILTVGAGQQYATVQAAVNAVPSGNSTWAQINVKAGTYKEQVTINKPFVCLAGEDPTRTTISYTIDNNILTGGTVLVKANDFAAANIAFENTHGKGESGGQNQAVALMAQGQRQQFRNCRFLSYQDTLYTNTGTQYFRDCLIQGSVDYIFGDATAVFDHCTMNNVAEGTAVSAPRTPQNVAYGFVFLGGALTASPTTSTVRNGQVRLGRPWGPYAAAAFLNVAMGAHIAADGWTTMSDNTLAETHFWEYKSTGAGANPTNAARATRQLSDAQAASYTVAKVLSPWTPGYSQ